MTYFASTRTGIAGQRIGYSGQPSMPVSYARVLEVILDSSHRYWKDLGGTQSLYGVFFQKLYRNDQISDIETEQTFQFAYCYKNTFRRVPLPGEIVALTTALSVETSMKLKVDSTKLYWVDIIPVWNSTHLNLYPDLNKVLDIKPFEESDKVKPLQLAPGDVTLEGRHGQSLRFGGTKITGSPIAETVNNKPYAILSVGHEGEETPQETRFENIDKDISSIYLVSDHKVPLTQANNKRKGWKDKKGPTKAAEYKGQQILQNSGRIYLNARDLDIELSAKEAIGLNSKIVAVDGEEYVGFDATKLYWGTNSFTEDEPCLKGKTTTDWLKDLCGQLNQLLEVMSKPSAPVPWISTVASKANMVKPMIQSMKERLPQLHSTKIFVE